MNTGITRTEAKNFVGLGWEKLLDELYDFLDALETDGVMIIVSEVKEKFGGLRVYYYISEGAELFDSAISEFIDELGTRSYTICEDCGEPGNPKSVFGWDKTLCGRCYSETIHGKLE